MDVETIHVHAPKSGIFLCGGPFDVKSPGPLSLRDAFIRSHAATPLSKHAIILAEESNAFFPLGTYKDILSFESDVAQISELIILFSESYGSVAELGAFVMVPETAIRLLVIIDDTNYKEHSFVRLGPLRALENKYGDSSVYVMNRKDIGLNTDKSSITINDLRSLNSPAFTLRIKSAIDARMLVARQPSKFDMQKNGHITKLIVGLIQHYSALTINEIDCLLFCINVKKSIEDIKNLLLCAERFGWIIADKRGMETYYLSIVEKEAMYYKNQKNMPIINKERVRADILQHWKRNDTNRFSSIQAAIGQIVP